MTLSRVAILISLLAGTVAAGLPNVRTTAENGVIIRRNGLYYNNRPLYANHGNPAFPYYWVFAGDRPMLRFGGDPWMDGTFFCGYQRADGRTKWLADFKSVEARYAGGRMEWVLADPELAGVVVRFHGMPLGEGTGMAAQAVVDGAKPGDHLIWLLGGAYRKDWVGKYDALADWATEVRQEGFNPAHCEGNSVRVENGVIRVEPPPGNRRRYTLAACDTPSELRVVDADFWTKPDALFASQDPKRAIAFGITPVENGRPVTWCARSRPEAEKAAPVDVASSYRAAWERVEALRTRVVVNTPDPHFDAAVMASVPAVDGLWRTVANGHSGAGDWVGIFLGWRTSFGSVVYGWHDRMLIQARHFIAMQNTGDKPVACGEYHKFMAEALTCPSPDSRYYRKGRIGEGPYNMQTQFFDQLIEDWRFTADPEMEKLLRPALELHLDYVADCFDPDGDGAYESYLNSWATDNQWYNGGATVEETCYAWRGHLAARDMARRAGDTAAVKRHEAKLALIRKGFFEKLWVAESGHPGAYREQGGHGRLHPDPWLPSIFLPPDCPGLLSPEQLASTLHFSEYGLGYETRPLGGVRIWDSNWVPGNWSLREMYPGDNYHLAQGYFVAGLPERGFEIMRGNYHESAFESPVPGNTGVWYGGTDFSDCVTPFARAVVCGLFGYRPDRPNGLITIAPQIPAAWDHASISHPEFSLSFKRGSSNSRLEVELKNPCAMELMVPFRGKKISSARLNGQTVKGEIRPGFSHSLFVVSAPASSKAVLELDVAEPMAQVEVESREVVCGEEVVLEAKGAEILEIRDSKGVLAQPRLADGKASGRVAAKAGHHRLVTKVKVGTVPQLRIFDFKVRDPKAESYAAEKNLLAAPAGAEWHCIDIAPQRNGRVTDIFRQEYLSPRPDTCSLRLARDGFRNWMGALIGFQPPGINLANTRSERPAPVYEGPLGDLALGDAFTLEAWVQADQLPEQGSCLLDMGELGLDTVPRGSLRVRCGDEVTANGLDILGGERVSHIALSYDRAKKKHEVYFDGVRLTRWQSDMANNAPLRLAPLIRVGADAAGGRRFCGAIKRIALSVGAAGAEALKGRNVDSPALPGALADWRFPEVGARSVASAVANAPTLTYTNIPHARSSGLPKPLLVENGELVAPQGARFKWNVGEKDIAFTSLWDNWPRKVTVPVNRKGESLWLLVAGSTNPMQVRIANAVLRFHYADGQTETLELVPPLNFWSLCKFIDRDYDMTREAFSLPHTPPSQVQLGSNCRTMIYGWKLRPEVVLKEVTLETLSQEVVVGLMGVSVCHLE